MPAAKTLKRDGLITVACALYALGFNWFFVPNHFTVGGFTGVAQIINHFLCHFKSIPFFMVNKRSICLHMIEKRFGSFLLHFLCSKNSIDMMNLDTVIMLIV